MVSMMADDKHSLDSVRLTAHDLIWLQERDDFGSHDSYAYVLRMIDLETGQRTLLAHDESILQFDAAGDVVIWETMADNGTPRIVVHSLSTGRERTMSDIGLGTFVTDGTYLAWNGSDPSDFIQTTTIGRR
jgi:hypothetical protein